MTEQEMLGIWNLNCIQGDVNLPNYSYNLPWQPYENYMQAQLVEAVPGQPGKLIILFPAEGTEDEQFHIHPISDRIITVLEGSGEFVAIKKFRKIRYELRPGCKVWMPRGVAHNFIGGPRGLLVESQHLPFVAFTDPLCLVRVRVD